MNKDQKGILIGIESLKEVLSKYFAEDLVIKIAGETGCADEVSAVVEESRKKQVTPAQLDRLARVEKWVNVLKEAICDAIVHERNVFLHVGEAKEILDLIIDEGAANAWVITR